MDSINATTPGAALENFQPREWLRFAAQKGVFVSLPIVFFWFGGMKFTAYEANAIEGLLANSPFLSILLNLFGAQGAAGVIGAAELTIGGLIAARFVAPRLAIIGTAGAIATFLITISLFVTTPGVFLPDVGGPAISVVPGQFLLKDLTLLAASVWALNDSLDATAAVRS